MNDNKITPFCINIESMSYEEVEEIFNMCIEAGATEDESMRYYQECGQEYLFFGVDNYNDTMFYSGDSYYSGGGQLALLLDTKEEVTKHLGLSVGVFDSKNKSIKEEAVTSTPQPFRVGDYVEVVSRGSSRAEVGMKGFVKSTEVPSTPNAPTACQMVTFESDCGITTEMYNGRFKLITEDIDTPQDDTIISPEIKQTLDELGIELVYLEAAGFGLFHDCLDDEAVYVQTKEEMLELFGAIRIILKFTQV